MPRRTVNRRIRLQKALEEQRSLERDLEKLNSANDQKECAEGIIRFVKAGAEQDPFLNPDNPFLVNENNLCGKCVIL